MNKEKLLSIYIPTYNRRSKALRQAKFILGEIEKLPNVELIVNDNCSSDDTREKLNGLLAGVKNAKLFVNETNVGMVGNVYLSKKYCNGEYLWIISDDDILHKGIVERAVEILLKHKNITYLLFNFRQVDDDIVKKEKSFCNWNGLKERADIEVISRFTELAPQLTLSTTAVYKREVLLATFTFLPVNEEASHAWSMFAPLLAMHRGSVYIEEPPWVDNNVHLEKGAWILTNVGYIARVTSMFIAFERLENDGYTKKEIQDIYIKYCYCVHKPVLMIMREFFKGHWLLVKSDLYRLFKIIHFHTIFFILQSIGIMLFQLAARIGHPILEYFRRLQKK